MRIHSLLLSSAALVASATVGLAADLPSKKAAPVDYVKVCTITSFTGFVIPGTDVCLKVGGFVRYQYGYTPQEHRFFRTAAGGGYGGDTGRARNNSGGGVAVASAKFDARTTTEYGLLRSFADIRVNSNGSAASVAADGSNAAIDKAYIQFGPWSFGKFQSFFDFYADAVSNITGLGSDNSTVGVAYTATLGNGFFATLALEDRNTGNYGVPTVGMPAAAFGAATAGSIGGIVTSGYRVPDAIGRLEYTGDWGSAALTAAAHQVRTTGTLASNYAETKLGWAVQGGVKVNLPMIAAGDALWLQAAYTEGALTYIGANNTGGGFGATQPLVAYADAIAVGPTGTVKLTKGFNALAAFQHYIMPNLDVSVWAGVTKVDFANGVLTGSGGGGFAARDFTIIQAGPQVSWVPVKGIRITATGNWYHVDTATKTTDYLAGVKSVDTKADGFQTLLRVQRDF